MDTPWIKDQKTSTSLDFRIRGESSDLDVDFPRQLADFSSAAKCEKRQIFSWQWKLQSCSFERMSSTSGVGEFCALKMMDFFLSFSFYNSVWIFVYSIFSIQRKSKSKSLQQSQGKSRVQILFIQLFRNLWNYIKENPAGAWWAMGRLPEPFAGNLSRKRVGLQKLWGSAIIEWCLRKKTKHDFSSDWFHQQLWQTSLEWSLTSRGNIDL